MGAQDVAEPDPATTEEVAETPEEVAELPPPRGWRDLWQVPALALGGLTLVAGLATAWATRPLPDVNARLNRAESLLEAQQYIDSLTEINEKVVPITGEEYFLDDHERRMRLLRGRAIALGQRKIGISTENNHRSVIREYTLAEQAEATLDPFDAELLARAHMAVGEFDEAIRRASGLGDHESERRISLFRDMATASLRGEFQDDERSRELLQILDDDPLLQTSDRVWVIATQTELRLAEGFASDAISRLLREMPRLQDADASELAQLYELLARAYMDDGSVQGARKQLARAEQLLGPGEPLMARVLLSQAKIAEQFGEPPDNLLDAKEKLQIVISRYSGSDSYFPALLSLAEVEAGLDGLEEATNVYRQLVDELRGSPNGGMDRSLVMTSLLNRVGERLEGGDPERAVRFAELAEDLYDRTGVPTRVLRSMADARFAWGDRIVREALEQTPSAVDLSGVDPVTRDEARQQFIHAGTYFRRFAERVVLLDDAAHADGIWHAALSFDRGGDLEAAVLGYREFSTGFPDHSKRAEATFNLARSHQALGEYAEAAAIYQQLIEVAVDRETRGGAGPFAAMSYVPLAKCLLLDSDPSNDNQADNLLATVLDGVVGDSTAQSFRDALIELGRLMYRRQDYPRAIERLTEALGRYPDHPDAAQLRFQLADAYRLESKSLTESLDRAGSSANRKRWSDLRESHLREAIGLFTEVRNEIDLIDPRRRTALEETYLRNAQFYLGDCVFELGDYEAAIRHYTAARERYAQHPASLVALVQIFNAYVQMGDLGRAQTAGQRARRFHESLDPAVFDDPLMPMNRDDWERWLDAMYEMSAQALAPSE